MSFAALPQHSAVSLRLTVGLTSLFLRLRLRVGDGGIASTGKHLASAGKPEAFRTVLRRSRQPFAQVGVLASADFAISHRLTLRSEGLRRD